MNLKEQLKQLKGAQKIVMMAASIVVVLCVLIAGGYGVWWVATAPRGPVDFAQLSESDIAQLHRQHNTRRRTSTPGRVNTLVGSLSDEDENFVAVGQEFSPAAPPLAILQESQPEGQANRPTFVENEQMLTDYETFHELAVLDGMLATQRDMMIRALTKMALTHDLSEVRFTVQHVQVPDGLTLEEHITQQGGVNNLHSEGGAVFIFSQDLANRIIGRDINTVAQTQESFYEFMREIEAIDFEALPPGHRPLVLPTW